MAGATALETWRVRELLSAQAVVALGAASVVMAVLGAAVTAWIVVRLPSDYFRDRTRHQTQLNPALRVGKNLLGLVAVGLGLFMAIPGIPGPGLITILLGVMLLDFPGKYRFERWLVHRKMIHGAIDQLRARFGRPPLLLPD